MFINNPHTLTDQVIVYVIYLFKIYTVSLDSPKALTMLIISTSVLIIILTIRKEVNNKIKTNHAKYAMILTNSYLKKQNYIIKVW